MCSCTWVALCSLRGMCLVNFLHFLHMMFYIPFLIFFILQLGLKLWLWLRISERLKKDPKLAFSQSLNGKQGHWVSLKFFISYIRKIFTQYRDNPLHHPAFFFTILLITEFVLYIIVILSTLTHFLYVP